MFAAGKQFIQNYHQKKILDAYLTQKNFYYVENRLFTKILHLVPSDATILQDLLLMSVSQLATMQVESHERLQEEVKLLRLTALTLKDGFIRKIRSKYYVDERDDLDVLTESVLQKLGLSGFGNITSKLKASFDSWWTSFKDDPSSASVIDALFNTDTKLDPNMTTQRTEFKAAWKELSEHRYPPISSAEVTYIQTIIRFFDDAFAEYHAGPQSRGDISKNSTWNMILLKVFPLLLKSVNDLTPDIRRTLMALTEALGKYIVGKSRSSETDVNTLTEGLMYQVSTLNKVTPPDMARDHVRRGTEAHDS